MSLDPVHTFFDAVEGKGCGPKWGDGGHHFRSRCPAHDGTNPTSLKVEVGADGRAVVCCHAHRCRVEDITAAVGLTVRDLFPPGHHRAAKQPRRPVKRSDFRGAAFDAVSALYALEELGETWSLMLTSTCPACWQPGAWLIAKSDGYVTAESKSQAYADCPEGCDSSRYVESLLARLNDPQPKAAA